MGESGKVGGFKGLVNSWCCVVHDDVEGKAKTSSKMGGHRRTN